MRILYISTNTLFAHNRLPHLCKVVHADTLRYKDGTVKGDVVKNICKDMYDVCICDTVELFDIADHIRKCGITVIGADILMSCIKNNSTYRDTILKLSNLYSLNKGLDVYVYTLWNGARYTHSLWILSTTGGRVGQVISEKGILWRGLSLVKMILSKSNYRGLVKILFTLEHGNISVKSIDGGMEGVELFAEVMRSDIVDVINSIISGGECKVSNEYVASVDIYRTITDVPVEYEDKALKHVWKYKCDTRESSITGRGRDIPEALRRCYRTIKRVEMNGKLYNKNVKEDINEVLNQLHKGGVI